jgi:hypothetical protein
VSTFTDMMELSNVLFYLFWPLGEIKSIEIFIRSVGGEFPIFSPALKNNQIIITKSENQHSRVSVASPNHYLRHAGIDPAQVPELVGSKVSLSQSWLYRNSFTFVIFVIFFNPLCV